MRNCFTQLIACVLVCCSFLLTTETASAINGNALTGLTITAVTYAPTCNGGANGSINM